MGIRERKAMSQPVTSSRPFDSMRRSWLEAASRELSAEELLELLVPLAQRGGAEGRGITDRGIGATPYTWV